MRRFSCRTPETLEKSGFFKQLNSGFFEIDLQIDLQFPERKIRGGFEDIPMPV
jgi:hypothetical protein